MLKITLLKINIVFLTLLIIFMIFASYNQALATIMSPCQIAQSGMIVPESEIQSDIKRLAAEAEKNKNDGTVAMAAAAGAEAVSRAKAADVRVVLSKAQSLLGAKYVMGGATPKGFDCSGFIMYVFDFAGVKLPHNAAAQADWGAPVDKASLAPGDLVFFSYYGSKGIGHSGIYLGNNQFIHSESYGKGVVITDINSSYYLKNYLGARRVLR